MLESITASGLTVTTFLICTISAIVLGVLTGCLFMVKNSKFNHGFILSLALIPAVVELIILMVSGSVGAGIAVAGAFSLVRFRSQPGTAREIASIFVVVAMGIACGMGYIFIAAAFFVIVAVVTLLLLVAGFGSTQHQQRDLRITIPEDLDYEGLFDDLFEKYTTSHELLRVKTTNMGTLYELEYIITMREAGISKQFIDDLRCRNGNLNIVCGLVSTNSDAL
ncbi:MAG: DUF4956 domain-containing protein [Oscillospiraceae bacterium]|nr:DUF4956 domain-containing protein [Oscillospiraceae bacterium]